MLLLHLSVLVWVACAKPVPEDHVVDMPAGGFHESDGSEVHPIVIASDMDKHTKVETESHQWYSTLRMGNLHINKNRNHAYVTWHSGLNFTSGLSNGGRGMEWSDLKIFNEKLLTVDDKTGLIYWIRNRTAIPWVFMSDGDGSHPEPYKGEWLTVRDGYLYVGGYGKEALTLEGKLKSHNPMFVKKIDINGGQVAVDWTNHFKALRQSLKIKFPGFIIHEAAQWSDVHQKWFFLPRQLSPDAWHYKGVQRMGTNMLLSTKDCFCEVTATQIGHRVGTRGFSAFQFIPGTNDSIIAAVKSEEVDDMPVASYMLVFHIDGTVLMNSTKLPGDTKFEGLEFYDWMENFGLEELPQDKQLASISLEPEPLTVPEKLDDLKETEEKREMTALEGSGAATKSGESGESKEE